MLFIFGAGASFGSQACPPPLGKDLFSTICEHFPNGVTNSLSDSYNESFINFEAGMKRLYAEKSDFDFTQLQKEMALTLLHFRPHENSLYAELLLLLRNNLDKVSFASLNYDVLFEEIANTQFNLPINYLEPVYKGDVEVHKIHGSVNFIPDLPPENIQNLRLVAPKGVSHISCERFKAVNPKEAYEFSSNNQTALGPIISQYIEGKYFLHSATSMNSVLERFLHRLRSANRIILVGVAVSLQDEHVWGELERSDARIVYVGLKEDCERFKSWAKDKGKSNFTSDILSFKSLLDRPELLL
jgi:hypothetical protein